MYRQEFGGGIEIVNIKKRLLPAVIIVVVTLVCVLLSRFTRVTFFMLLAIASAFELQNVLFQAEMPISKALMIVYIAAQALLCLCRVSVGWMAALYCLAVFAAMFWAILKPERGARFAAANLFALTWPFGLYAVILYAAASDAWLMTLTLGVLGTWACDCMALIGGKYLGSHKMAPVVSPHKTWEGAVVGGLSAALAGALIAWILGWQLGMCVCVTFVASCFGQVGDLAASLMKRAAGVKDYGHLMPEHGGIMDKMDSMLFSLPAAYFMLALFIPNIF